MEDKNLTAESPTRTVDKMYCDQLLLEMYRRSIEQKTDHFDSKEFYRTYVMDRFGLKLEEFDKCLAELENKGYIKITAHYRQNIEGENSIPTGFQVMEEGKKYCVILEGNTE